MIALIHKIEINIAILRRKSKFFVKKSIPGNKIMIQQNKLPIK